MEKSENDALFQNILDFYNETWKGVEKPFKVNDYLKKKLKINKETLADRHISSQPIEFIAEDGSIKYNKRKLTELPNCLANINSGLALEKACELVFFNYEFMHAKFACESLNEVLDDLKKLLDELSSWSYQKETKSNYQQLNIFKKLMLMIGSQIEDCPDSFAFHLPSRFLCFYRQNHIRNLIEACDLQSVRHCSLISPYVQQESPGGYLIACLAKDNQSIKNMIFLIPYFITVSSSKITVYAIHQSPIPFYLYDLKIPKQSFLREYFSKQNEKAKTSIQLIKFHLDNYKDDEISLQCICAKSFMKQARDFDQDEGMIMLQNPGSASFVFLIVHKYYVFVMTPTKEIHQILSNWIKKKMN